MKLLKLLFRHFAFNKKQIEQLSNTFNNAGQVVLGGMIVTPIVAGIDSATIPVVVLGSGLVFICWITSLLLLRKRKDKKK